MKKMWVVSVCAVMVLIICPIKAWSNGFAINEHGAKALGMGGAFVAQANDPSAVYYNPAGIVQLEGTQVSAGMALILPDATFESKGTSVAGRAGTTGVEAQSFFVPNFYVTHMLSPKLSLGLGTFSNYGLSTEWPDDWEGRYITGGVKAEIVTLSVNPVIAYRPFKRVSFAAGPVLQYMDIELKNKIPNPGAPFSPAADLDSKLTGDSWDWGWNVGLLVWLSDSVKVGASYRSQIEHNINGDARITGIPTASAKSDIELPAIAYVGAAWDVGSLTLEFDAHWIDWSAYKELSARFDILPPLSSQKDWHDAWAYRFGINYRLSSSFDIRAGLIYDESPIPDKTLDPLVPSGDRWLYTFGLGYHQGGFSVDFGYNYLDDEERSFNNEVGNYTAKFGGGGQVAGKFTDVDAHVFMLNLRYAF